MKYILVTIILFSVGCTDFDFHDVRSAEEDLDADTGTRRVSQQISNTDNRPLLDILLVIDPSQTMHDEQTKMAAKFLSLVNVLKNGNINWRLAITTTDARDMYTDAGGQMVGRGILLEYRLLLGSTFSRQGITFIDSTTINAEALFSATIQRTNTEVGFDNEQGICAAYEAIQRSQLAGSENLPNRNFFRKDAALNIIFVSDEDDRGTQNCSRPQNLINLVKEAWSGQKLLTSHSVVMRDTDLLVGGSCSIGVLEAEGESYLALSDLTGGVKGSICASDYGSQLSAIGQSAKEKSKTYQLQCQPFDLDKNGSPEIAVFDDKGNSLNLNYTLEKDQITFENQLPLGIIELKYRCFR